MNYIAPCPNCGTLEKTQWFRYEENPFVDVMCWENCGMDFRVSYWWYLLNRIEVDQEDES